MIALTRLSGDRFVLNAELIRTIEERPDTVVTLVNGDRMVVKESSKEIIDRVVDYGRHLRRMSPPS